VERRELYAAIKRCGGVADLSNRAKFRLTGADRIRYLNGQITNDLRKLPPHGSLYACVTTAKGRMCGDLFITAGPDHLLIDAEASLRESMAARLGRYIVADDVVLEDVTDEVQLLHCYNLAEPPLAETGEVWVRRSNRFGAHGWDVIAPAAQPAPVPVDLPVIDEPMREVLRIEAGVPRWGFELGEETLPPEAGLDRTAVDFHKGCYIGQEVISRIESVGHVNRTLSGFIAAGADPDSLPGAELFLDERSAGILTSAAFSFGLETPIALGYLKRGIDAASLRAGFTDGSRTCLVEVTPLPFIP
jgi:folate-binding protein YgfZ